MSPLLFDLAGLRTSIVDDALELFAKAEAEGGGDIWAPHPNPLVRRIVEVFTERGLQRSAALTSELEKWLAGAHHRPALSTSVPPTRPGAMLRWTSAELDLVRTFLEALRPSEFTLDDWMMVVDYLVQRYLPIDDLRSEADWLATRSGLMGRIQAALGSVAQPDHLLAQLPAPAFAARVLSPAAQSAIDFGRARACEAVSAVADATRHRLRNLVVDHQERVLTGDLTGEALETKLRDAEGALNRDWRRLAVTEATEMVNQGFIAAQAPGTKVRRVEQYRGACPRCRSIHGLVLTCVDPAKPDKDGDTEVWVGKTNRGRSASPHRRGAGGLVEREPEERWWAAAGAMHPHCRGSWVRVTAAPADPTFDDWLAKLRERRA